MDSDETLQYFCDASRHLVCAPYSRENLHRMARELGIKACWFHASRLRCHCDIPKRRTREITEQCTLMSSREILAVMKGTYVATNSANQATREVR